MKRKLGILGACGAVALAVGIYVNDNAWAQAPAKPATPAPSPAAGRTRVAIVNLQEVLKGYKKLEAINEEIKQKYQEFEKLIKDKQAEAKKQGDVVADPKSTPQQREAAETAMGKIRLELEDLNKKGQKEVLKLRDDRLSLVYREVNDVVQQYAVQNGIDLVFRFQEDWGTDYHNPTNVMQRLEKAGFWPMYWDPALNITGAVKEMLFQKYAAGATPGAVKPASGP